MIVVMVDIYGCAGYVWVGCIHVDVADSVGVVDMYGCGGYVSMLLVLNCVILCWASAYYLVS